MDATVMDEAGRRCGAEIIAIDRPGIGRSDLWSMPSVGQWGHTVAQVAQLLHLDDFAVAGWSGGGPYALACAAAMPGRVRAVATVAGMAPLERLKHVFEIGFLPDELLIPAARWTPTIAAALLRLIRHVPPRVLGWVLPHLAGSRDRAALDPPPLSLLATHREVMRGGVQGMVDEYRRYYGSWGFDLGEVQQSVTVWQGEEDTLVPMKHARRLASLLPNHTLMTVPSTGHLLPVVMANEILDDLAPTPRRKSARTSN
ncbi:MAG: alpha/beta hydrolase [Mycobacteriaceae bacterium]|nr:alpha/beta hydrolase [Mycobacteriaceae bacterium]MBV9640956.1 alpha/beta hydrolase [Mycobacteriaceae bacterium]